MNFALRNEIADAIKERQDWERRQTTFYTMRHQGLKRAAKPHPNAADLHFALIDALVGKLKPFYFQQLYATEQFATFISLLTKFQDITSAVGAWYDYKLKQQTNIEPEVMAMIDYMVMAGRAVIKVPWDVEEKRICSTRLTPCISWCHPTRWNSRKRRGASTSCTCPKPSTRRTRSSGRTKLS